MMENLELDIGLRFSVISTEDVEHIKQVVAKFTKKEVGGLGVGIEIRYNFNPNDSARLRKDCDMAGYLEEAKLLPVYLIFSSISPRDEAISRLTRAGWSFLIGTQASDFSKQLFGLDLSDILNQKRVRSEVRKEVRQLFNEMFQSHAFTQVLKVREERSPYGL